MKTAVKILTALVVIAVAACSVYIMANGLGLSDKFDFGAGAYYYADIPDFDKIEKSVSYVSGVPLWCHIVLFAGWGYLMYRLWCKIEDA